jgi:hypothetical protein
LEGNYESSRQGHVANDDTADGKVDYDRFREPEQDGCIRRHLEPHLHAMLLGTALTLLQDAVEIVISCAIVENVVLEAPRCDME